MTYDKVQFSLNRHMYVQNGNLEQLLDHPIEGMLRCCPPISCGGEAKFKFTSITSEKVTVTQVKQKRKVSAYESPLANIKEVTERRNSERNSNKFKELSDDNLYIGNKLEKTRNDYSCDRIEMIDIIPTDSSEYKPRMELFPKYIEEKMSLSSGSRRSSCDAGKLENGMTSDKSDSTSKSEHRDDNSIPKLDFDQEDIHRCKKNMEKSSNKSNESTSNYSFRDNVTTKLPNIKCDHILAGRDISINHKHNGTEDVRSDSDNCMVCEITEATARYASVEANRLLLEIVYPHEFYDKFQRSSKRARINRHQRNLDITRDQIKICKQATVAPKVWRRERTTIMPSQSIMSDRPDPPNSVRETYRSKIRERSEQDLSPEKRIKRDKDEPKKEIHLQCKAKDNALIVTEDSGGQKLIFKGLKGWILKKDDLCKNKMHKEIKNSLYQVNSLGMNFSIPEYNASLNDRKIQLGRSFTSITTPRPPETQYPIRKSVTQNYSPRSQLTVTNPPRDIRSVPTRTISGLQRGYTHVPKLFSDASTEDSFKSPQTTKVSIEKDKTMTSNVLPNTKGNTKLSFPPLVNDMKTRSYTFTQF